ncbi:MAG: HAMP domain-containing protein, partial [Cyanobacteria bacterium J06576_12]
QSRTHQQQLIPLSEFPEDFQDEYAHILAHADSIQNAWISLDEHLQVGQQTVSNNATPGTNLESQNDTDLIQFAQTYRGVDRQYLRELDKLVTQVDITNIETPKQLRQAQKQLLAFTNSDLAIEFDGISDALSGLIKNAQNSHNAASEASIKSEYLRNQIILLSMALSVCVAAILVLITSRAINHPLKVVEETATRVVETENFDLRTAVFTKDEVGSLAIALNQLIEWVSHKTQALETARDTLEKSVKERTQELNAIIDSLGNGLLVVSDQGAIVRINPTLKDLFELPGHKLENQPVQSFFEGRIIQLIQQSQTNPTERLTDELHLPNNRIGQAIVTAIVSEGNTDNAEKDTGRDLSQQVVGTVVLIRDITTEKAVDQMKTDFISTVSHELRTPLTTAGSNTLSSFF